MKEGLAWVEDAIITAASKFMLNRFSFGASRIWLELTALHPPPSPMCLFPLSAGGTKQHSFQYLSTPLTLPAKSALQQLDVRSTHSQMYSCFVLLYIIRTGRLD